MPRAAHGIQPPKPPDAFLSYTRFDDQHDGGTISEFCQRLASAVRAVTGEPFEIFQDVDDIDVGERWSGKLDRDARPRRGSSFRSSRPAISRARRVGTSWRNSCRPKKSAGGAIWSYRSTTSSATCSRMRSSAQPILGDEIHERQRYDWRELRHSSFRNRKVRLRSTSSARQIAGRANARVPAVPRPHRRRDTARRRRGEARASAAAAAPRPEQRQTTRWPRHGESRRAKRTRVTEQRYTESDSNPARCSATRTRRGARSWSSSRRASS